MTIPTIVTATGKAPAAAAIRQALACGRSECSCRRSSGRVHCPVSSHPDEHPSFGVTVNAQRLLVRCWAGCTQDAVIDALRERGLWPSAPSKNGTAPRAVGRTKKSTVHLVRAGDGRLVAQHLRKGRWLHPDGTFSKGGEIKPSELPLYGVEHLRDLADGDEVVLAEGEKAADALRARTIVALGTYGTSATPCDDSLGPLLRFRVLLWPDNDDGGRGHMREIAYALQRLDHRDVRLVEWPDAPDKGDAADFTGDDDALRQLLATAVKWMPGEAVDLATLLDDVRDLIRRYVVLTDDQADAIALWVTHTHALDAFDVTPYLSITSPEKRSGKTRLLEVLRRLVARPWLTARTSTAALYRRVDAESPTLLLDESDAAFKSSDEYAEGLRGVLNSGFERGGSTTVCVGQGKDISYKEFSTFGAKALAGIGTLPDTLADRSISIRMKRQGPGERADKLRRRGVDLATAPLRERMMSWALVAVTTLANAEPAIPDELDDRAADGWEPLLAIADLATGDWPQRARLAAMSLSVGDEREDGSLGVRLLRDIQGVFGRNVTRLTIGELVGALLSLAEAPWSDLKGKPLNARSLGWRLKGYGIKSKQHERGGPRGYDREMFQDAFSRYLGKTDENRETDAPDRYDASVVADASVSGGMGERTPECCCGSVEISGYTPDGDPRCAEHNTLPGDGHLARVGAGLGLSIIARRPAFALCCTDDANAPGDFREARR